MKLSIFASFNGPPSTISCIIQLTYVSATAEAESLMLVFFELRAQFIRSNRRNVLILSNPQIFSSISEGSRAIVSSTWDLIDALASSISKKVQDFLGAFEPVGFGEWKFLFGWWGVERMRGKVEFCHVNVCKYYIAESTITAQATASRKRKENRPTLLFRREMILFNDFKGIYPYECNWMNNFIADYS